jgi:adenylosuccinate lyase
VLNGLSSDEQVDAQELAKTVKRLAPRWFVMRDVHSKAGTVLLKARTTMSLLRGPMTRNEVREAVQGRKEDWKREDAQEQGPE